MDTGHMIERKLIRDQWGDILQVDLYVRQTPEKCRQNKWSEIDDDVCLCVCVPM